MRYSEADWNTAAVREIETLGSESSGYAMYMASKTLAEQGEFELSFPYTRTWVIIRVLSLKRRGSLLRIIKLRLGGTWW